LGKIRSVILGGQNAGFLGQLDIGANCSLGELAFEANLIVNY